MPVELGRDKEGCFARWGKSGARYHYTCGNEEARNSAKQKAYMQGLAITGGKGEYQDTLKVGDAVSWKTADQNPRGRIREIVREGAKKVPGVDFEINGTPENPGYIIEIYRESDGRWEPSGEYVGRKGDSILKNVKLSVKVNAVKQKFQSYTDYPQAATENAKTALRWAEENGWGDCGTPIGKQRANQLANREPISEDTIARMAAFERHRQNSKRALGEGCGRLMWLAWGGDEGVAWAQRKLKEIRKD